jgi:hypothetical protein
MDQLKIALIIILILIRINYKLEDKEIILGINISLIG